MIDTLEIVPDNSFLVTSIQSSIIPSLTLPRIKQVGCKVFYFIFLSFLQMSITLLLSVTVGEPGIEAACLM